jgi:CheY-like chemotaxis protein
MSEKHALIVDDSRIAQLKLRKMLARYDLEVDCVNSAEDALSYLSYRRPAVVFMDHMMQGMDGFEALRVIKSNPDTAMVPIIMYTSKSGDVYVGQARALGAIDVLTKDVIEPSNLDKVLQGVKILPKTDTPHSEPITAVNGNPPRPATSSGDDANGMSAIRQLREQIARMFEIHVISIKQEIGDSNRAMMRRLFKEIQDLKSRPTPLPATIPPKLREEIPQASSPSPRRNGLLTVIVLLGFLVIFYQQYQNGKQQDTLNQRYLELNQFLESEHETLTEKYNILNASFTDSRGNNNADAGYAALAWSINRKNQFEFGKTALDEEQLSILSGLIHHLNNADFTGIIRLDVYFGNFCVTTDKNGAFALPAPESLATNCTFLTSRDSDYSLDNQLSWAFNNYLLTAPELRGEGDIAVEIESHGIDNPLHRYPDPFSVNTAGEWNRIAQMNNRVNVTIIPTP